jgi:hypothetical protein
MTSVPCSWVALGVPHSPHDWEVQPGMTSVPCPGVPAPEGTDVEDAALRAKVSHVVRGIIGYDCEEPAIDALMGLFAQHHCASCDMHACGDLSPMRRLTRLQAARLLDKVRRNDEMDGRG